MKRGIDTKTMTVDRVLAEKVGATAADTVRRSYENLKEPENAPETIARKGRNDPLDETGKLIKSIKHRVR